MWRNYWTIAIRTLPKSKTYSIINIAGLAVGMAACVMILLYINYERSYDSWLPNIENTYQLQIAIGIAVTTVAGHAVRVARANPIHALRYE